MLLGDQLAEVLIKDGKAVKLHRFRLGDLLAGLAVGLAGAQFQDDIVSVGDEGLHLLHGRPRPVQLVCRIKRVPVALVAVRDLRLHGQLAIGV